MGKKTIHEATAPTFVFRVPGVLIPKGCSIKFIYPDMLLGPRSRRAGPESFDRTAKCRSVIAYH